MRISRKLISFVTAIAAMAVMVALPANAQMTLDELVNKAGEEGIVAMNTSTTRYPSSAAPGLSKAISEKFGIDLEVEFVNSSPVPVITGQVIKETLAGVKPSFDVFPLPLFLTVPLSEAGAVETIDWAGIGVDPDLIDPNGNAVWIHTIPRAVTYNTDLVEADDIPTRLEDLLDPKWKGKIAGPGFGGAYGMISVPVLGEEKASDWLKTLYEDQDLAVIRSMTDVPTRVANGEFSIGMGVPANYSGLVTKGAPIANAPLEKVGSQPYYMFVLKNAESPHAGALLTYFFCCTPEGKKAQLEHMNTAMFDTPGSEQNEVGGDGRGVAPTTEWQLTQQRRVAEALDKLIGR